MSLDVANDFYNPRLAVSGKYFLVYDRGDTSCSYSVYNSFAELKNESFEFPITIAEVSEELNLTSEDIGARRLHTVMEYLLEDISFNAGGDYPTFTLQIDKNYVDEHLKKLTGDRNLKKYILCY